MFKPDRFLEGSVERSPTKPYNVSLDDDGDALELLCQILHYLSPPMTTSTSILEQFALVCHKYQCANAGRLHAKLSIHAVIASEPGSRGPEEHKRLFWASYAFDINQEFGNSGVAVASRIRPDAVEVPLHDAMPEAIGGMCVFLYTWDILGPALTNSVQTPSSSGVEKWFGPCPRSWPRL